MVLKEDLLGSPLSMWYANIYYRLSRILYQQNKVYRAWKNYNEALKISKKWGTSDDIYMTTLREEYGKELEAQAKQF